MGFLNQQVNDRYALYCGDTMEMLAGLPDDSIHASIYSPPFAGLYEYSSDLRDFSNVQDPGDFLARYGYLAAELERVIMPGRCVGVHAALVPTGNTGRDGYDDFPGGLIRVHQAHGMDLIARHVIWKEPLAVRNRTMAKNLAHKTIVYDATYGGVAAPDELLVFRKRGANPVPVAHPNGFTGDYAGAEQPPAELRRYRGWDGDQKANRWSHWIWRRYASSVWDDIRIDRVLPFRDAKDPDDEKHVHPLQLDVIERFIDMRTLPGERVLTPFAGVGSEVYAAVSMGRYGIGAELKATYYTQAVRNLAAVDTDRQVVDLPLFSDLGSDPVGGDAP